jgi:hypothetical protein
MQSREGSRDKESLLPHGNLLSCHLKFLNDITPYILLDITKQNLNHQMDHLHLKLKNAH